MYFRKKLAAVKFRNKLKAFLKIVFPSTTPEVVLFFAFLTAYGVLGSVIAVNYRIIFDNRIPWDAYFSFDNRAIVMTGGGFERHPLANYFFDLVRNAGKQFSTGKYNSDFRLFLAWCSALAVSLSLVQIYKYLKNIIRLPIYLSIFLVLFFSFFSTSILLSFTPETYTYTLFLLVLFNYYAALKIRNEEKIPGAALTLATVSLGGLTITNAAKVFIPVLFEKDLFRNWRKTGNAVLRSCMAAGIFILLYLARLNFDIERIFTKTASQYDKFSDPKVTPMWDMVISWFWGGNMLFPGFVIRDYHNAKGFEYKALFMDVYNGSLPYVFCGLLFILFVLGLVRNFRNVLVQILILSFLLDVVIHIVLKFGLHTSYIYGGHFIFVVPLIMGWLLYSFRENRTGFISVLSVLVLLFVFLVINNVVRMQEFFHFLEAYYK